MKTFVLVGVFFGTIVITDGSSKLIFANRYNICTLDTKVNQSSPNLVVTGLEDVAALDFMHDEQMVYWTDITQEKIRAARLNGSLNTADILSSGLVSPDGLACDWVTRKLYWVDSETNRIEVCGLNGTIRKVLVWQELDQPRALALDPRNGYMYWTDWGETAKIERMGMDGIEGSRSILVSSNIFWPNGLTLDYDENRMFWTDARLRYIHSANLDGSDRRVIIRGSLPHPFAITLSEDTIYWTDWHLRAIFSCDKANGSNIRMITDELNLPMDIHVMDARRQPSVVSRCGLDNGGCSHLCLLSPWPPFFSCQCPTGIRLLLDNKTCDHGPNEMLLLVRRTDIRLISLDTPDHTDLTLDIRNIRHAIALDYDPVDQMVYWTDDKLHAIRRSRLNGTGAETVIDVEVYNPDGIAVDWVARNLYWTDAGTDRIQVCRLNGSSRRVIISDRLQEPRAIILDPVAGQMYWTDWGNDTKIEQSNLDGSDRVTLVNTSIGWPNGLAIDRSQRKLYWADAKLDLIEYMNLDGSDRRILLSENLPHVFGFTLLGDFVYWTDWQRRAIESVHKSNAKQRTVIIDQLPDVMGLTAVNISSYEGENSCSHGNGGCSHLCLYRAQGTAICTCPFGMELLASDEKTCTVPEAFILYSTQSEVHMVSLDSPDRDSVIPLHRLTNVVDIHYSVSDGRLYWIDISNKVIARVFVNGSSEQVVVSSGLESPESLAVDHLALNLYWADGGTGRIEMARHDGSLRRVLVWTDNKPQALVLVPNRGYMFWSNVVNSPRIERATLDGRERQVIVTGLGHVNSMTLDPTEGRLYWTNSDKGRIESSDLDGFNRVDIVAGLDQPFGLTLHGQHIYWIERYSHNILRADKTNGADQRLLVSSPVFPMAVTVFHTALNSGWSSCRLQNGGCSHLCILDVRYSEIQLSTHHCACASHFSLSSDNRTCDASDSVMLLSLKNSVLQLSFGEFADSVDMLLPIPPKTMHGIQALDFNPVDNYIYWIDGRTKSIRKIHSNGSAMVILRQNLPGYDAISPYDVVLNTQDGLLYWSDAKRNVISGMHLDGTNIGVIVNDSIQKPRHLAVASEHSLIFWTNVLPHLQSIECAGADGTRHRTIFSSRFGRLGPIVADEELKKIFWTDLEFRTIESGNFDGTNRSVLVESIPEPVAMAIHGEHLYWISKDSKSLERVNKYTGHGRMTLKTRLSQLSDLVIVRRRRLKASSRNPCGGKCSHLCIRDADGIARCACPLGMALDDDEETCSPSHTCSEDQFSCLSGTNLCIPITWKCDGESDCKDGSDEVNCSSCSLSHFLCQTTGECIPLEHQCNGRIDCLDRSDELKCPPCVQNSLGCVNDRTCFLPSQRCDKIVDCWDGSDEMNCATAGAKTQYTVVIIGIICGVLIVIVIVTAVYIFRGKDNKCAKVYNDNSLILVAQNTDSLVLEGKSTSTRNGITPLLSSQSSDHQENIGWSCEHISDTFTLMSGISQYPKHTIDPHPTPVTSEGDGSTTVNSSSLTLRVKRPHRHRHKRPMVPLHPTPCSTDVCDDSDLQGGCDAHFLSSTETGFETDLNPHPPTPCSQFMSEASSCPPSPSTQRNLYLPILDLTYNRATNCL